MDSTDPEPLTSEEVEELFDAVDCDEAIEEDHIEFFSQLGTRVHELKHKKNKIRQ